ncbi:hypothetical protein QGN32_18945 [Mycolicibacterium sp. ND9-15]|uniref:hypothetical protein n=1 Tax=Mycolicibacterium sp. ND9-15 TaxID=3042320 RepID=UPI002DD9305A|nr:hypothetical protein [Mycolicibacterium sp. ND9-15]WSE55481.1 hypothetical protein QGN32_18945 [Mycolicibacterium sp. ND9-15]
MGRKRRAKRPPPPLPAPRRVEAGPDGYEYEVRSIPAARAVKTYRCPGCDHEIRPGTTHLVVLPTGMGEDRAVEDRRHWHRPCWTHRATRGPTRKWS